MDDGESNKWSNLEMECDVECWTWMMRPVDITADWAPDIHLVNPSAEAPRDTLLHYSWDSEGEIKDMQGDYWTKLTTNTTVFSCH